MIKKSFVQSIAEKNAKVVTLCEYLGTLRTECMRTYQSEGANGTHLFGEMHKLYAQICVLNEKLSIAVRNYMLSDETTLKQNYECFRKLLLDIDNKGNHGGAFVQFADIDAKELGFFYSVSELASAVTILYNKYLTTLDEVRKARTKRERLADRKARLLAELAELENEESESE